MSESGSGVWTFTGGVVRVGENPGADTTQRKVLVHTPNNEVITSYELLEQHLLELGWKRYNEDPNLLQFHKPSSVELISLPTDFSRFKVIHMYDVVVKNRSAFQVMDA